jgi:protein-disulfide isomerase
MDSPFRRGISVYVNPFRDCHMSPIGTSRTKQPRSRPRASPATSVAWADSARPGAVRIVYRHWPLETHRLARPAALASECAKRDGKYWQAHDALFAHPDSIGVRSWGALAVLLAIPDTNAFAACVRDSSEIAVLRRDLSAVKQLGGRGTPTVLLNQYLVHGAESVDTLLAYIDRERQRLR